MIQVAIDSKDIDRAILWAATLRGQLPFAASQALNQLAFQVAQDLKAQTPAFFDRPNAYTQKGFFYVKSTKANLTALVTAGNPRDPNDRRRRYLSTQIAGRARGRKGAEIKTGSIAPALRGRQLVPTRNIKLDSFGNVPRSMWSKINADNPNIFVGAPRGGSRSFGVYQRKGKTLKALMIAKDATDYDARFPMERIAWQVIDRNWPRYLRSSLERALATAR